jgi:DNA-binding MarR family transcriptional regulator
MTTTNAEVHALVRQLREVTAASPDAWSDVDLTFTQMRALFVLAARQPVRVGDLARALGMSLASASALSERLGRQGYVVRQRGVEDQRTVFLVLSVRGARLLDRLERQSTAQLSKAIRGMTEAERKALTVSLRAFVRLAPRTSARTPPRLRTKTSQ